MNEDKPEIDVERFLEDYLPNQDRDDDEMFHIKNAFDTALNYIEKKIFIQALQDVCARISDSITPIH